MIGLGMTNVTTAITNRPTNHIQGDSAAIARPPSSGTTGSRLKRFRNSPVKTSASQKPSPASLNASGSSARQPSVPRIGPARPTRASAVASSPSDFAITAAPRNGMNIGALASMPSRRSWMTWPISWTSSSSTKPAANFQPHRKL